MPATYAHYRFGKDVLDTLSDKWITSDRKYERLFMIGLHGPDILFFYHPFKPNPVNRQGIELHHHIASSFFAKSLSVVNSFEDSSERKAAMAYLCGVICHYVLDKTCHPYIEELADSTAYYHSDIESQFDYILLKADGFDPVGKKVTAHIFPSCYNAGIITKFYSATTRAKIHTALFEFIHFNNMLASKPGFGRRLTLFTFKLTRRYEYMKGMLIPLSRDDAMDGYMSRLRTLYEKAVPVAASLIEELPLNLNGSLPLSCEYDHTFGRD